MTVSGGGVTTCGGTLSAIKGSSSVILTGGVIPAAGSCTVTVNVTASCAAPAPSRSKLRPLWAQGNQCTFVNLLSVGALQTSVGSNSASANATLIVSATAGTPEVLKNFAPGQVVAGTPSTLTITLYNTLGTVTSITAPLTDQMPSGMVVAGTAATTCGGSLLANQGSSSVTLSTGSIPAYGTCTVSVPVTAPCVAAPNVTQCTYINTLPVGALRTGGGGSVQPASATLIVTPLAPVPPPTLLNNFSPAYIVAKGTAALTLTLRNPNYKVSTLTAPFTDNLPAGVVVAGTATTTCNGALIASVGGSTVTLSGGSIPAYGSCTVKVQVTAPAAGTFINTLPVGALQTNSGSNVLAVSATLNVSK